MQWTNKGSHLLLQIRIAVMYGKLINDFKKWNPNIKIENNERDYIDEEV